MNPLTLDMPNLIVDFPRERNSRVCFSAMSDLWVYESELNVNETNKIWYSENEYKNMKQDLKRSILKKNNTNRRPSNQAGTAASANEGLMENNGQDGETEDEIDLLGPNVIRWVHAHKISHRMAVLEEQERQGRTGERSPSKLAFVSHLYSQWSTIRAQRPMRQGSIDEVASNITIVT